MPNEVQQVEPIDVDRKDAAKSDKAGGADLTQLITKSAVIAAIAVAAIVAAFIVTTKVLKPMMATDPNTAQTQPEPAAHDGHGGETGTAEAGHGGELLFEIEQIIVNPASTVGSRFLSCSVAFEIESPDALEIFEAKEIKIRDALITILSARTVDELSDARLREPLRRQILARVNKLTDPAAASAVYFKDFVLQ